MSHSSNASNRVVVIDGAKFHEEQDPHWKTHKSYIHFVSDLDTDYKRSLNHRQRLNSSYLSALDAAKRSYPLFQIYLKILCQIGETVDHSQFEFKLNQSSITCIVDIYYVSGFTQTIVPMNTPANIHNGHHAPSKQIPKKKNLRTLNQSLITAVQQQQRAYTYDGEPIYIQHAPTASNHLQTKYMESHTTDSHKMELDPAEKQENDAKYDTEDEDHEMQDSDENEESILWRFYGEKKPSGSIQWPTCMDDTFFRHRPDVVRSNNDLTTFTFVNNNPEVNARRPAYLDDHSDVEDSESNELSINFRSNHPIPSDIFMYYFEVTVAHNHIQSHNTKFKRCYFGLIPQSKIYFPPEKEDKRQCQALQDMFLNKRKKKRDQNANSSSTSSLKLLANVVGTIDSNEKRNVERKQRKRLLMNRYLTKMKKNYMKRNKKGADLFGTNHNLYEEDETSADEDWFESDDNAEPAAAVQAIDDDVKMDKEEKCEIDHTPSGAHREKQIFREQCIQSMKECDKLFYNLWCDETILYSSEDEAVTEEERIRSCAEAAVRNDASDDTSAMEILQSRLMSKFEPSQTAKDTFVTQVFDDRLITNNSICVKVHSNLFTISKKFIYADEYYNNVYQSAIANDMKAKERMKQEERKQENEDEDEDDEDDRITVDGWERIDDETFFLTKPENFEKQIHLNSWRQKRVPPLFLADNDGDMEDHSEDDDDERIQTRFDANEDGNNEYGVMDDGNILINGLESFGLVSPKRKSHNLDAEEEDEEEEEERGTERDVVYNNGIDDIKENDVYKRWKPKDETDEKRQRKSRYNKQVDIVTKFKRKIRNHDTIGIGINFHLRSLFVTVNGQLVNDKKYNKALLFRDVFINEPLYIFGILKHFGNQLSYNFGQRKFKFDLNRYFSNEYVGWIKRNNNYISKFMRNTHRSNRINKKLLDSAILDHCIYEGFQGTVQGLMAKMFGHENGNKLMAHLTICNEVFKSMNIRRCIKQSIHNGDVYKAKQCIKQLKMNHFVMQYPIAWFQLLQQEMVELLRTNKIKEAKYLYEHELLQFESFVASGGDDLSAEEEDKRILNTELNILATVLINCVHYNCFNISGMAMEYRYLFDVKRRYRLRDMIHNLIYNHMTKREHERIHCLYNASLSSSSANDAFKLSTYDSQLHLLLKHLCTVYDCYKSNFANYLENIRFV